MSGQSSAWQIGGIAELQFAWRPWLQGAADGTQYIFRRTFAAQTQVIAEHSTRHYVDKHNDPQAVNHARLGPAVRGGHQHYHATVKLVRVTLDALEWSKKRPTRSVAAACLARRVIAGKLTCSGRILGKHAIDETGERHVTTLLDVEWPFASALEAAFAQFSEKPSEHCHAWPKRRFEVAAFAQDVLAQTAFESSPRGRFTNPLQCTRCSAAPRIRLDRCLSIVGFHARIRQQSAPALNVSVGMGCEAAFGEQPVGLDAAHRACCLKVRVGSAVEIQADSALTSPVQRFTFRGERGSVDSGPGCEIDLARIQTGTLRRVACSEAWPSSHLSSTVTSIHRNKGR